MASPVPREGGAFLQPTGSVALNQWGDFIIWTRWVLTHEAIAHMNVQAYGRTIAWDRVQLFARNIKPTADPMYRQLVEDVIAFRGGLIAEGSPPDDAIFAMWDLVNQELERQDRLGRRKKPSLLMNSKAIMERAALASGEAD